MLVQKQEKHRMVMVDVPSLSLPRAFFPHEKVQSISGKKDTKTLKKKSKKPEMLAKTAEHIRETPLMHLHITYDMFEH